MAKQKINPLRSVSIVTGGLATLVGSVQALLMGSDIIPDDAKGVVGLVCGIVFAVLGAVAVVVRQLQGESDGSASPPIAWGSGGKVAVLAIGAGMLGASLLATSCAPAWQAGGYGVAVAGQACEPAHAECRAACERDLDDPWEREAALIACDCGVRYCDLGRRWAAHEMARKAAEAAAREAAQPAPSEP